MGPGRADRAPPGLRERSRPIRPICRTLQLAGDSNPLYVLHDMRQTELAWPTYEADALDAAGDGSSIRAPIVGRVARVFVKAGDAVAKGDRIAVVEAMKMEHVLHAAPRRRRRQRGRARGRAGGGGRPDRRAGRLSQPSFYFRNSGEIRLGSSSDTFGQTITSARTRSIGISMMPVSLMASRMRMPATEQATNRHNP